MSPPRSLKEATERLRVSNDRLEAHLRGDSDNPIERVANAPDIGLPDATERAKRYWDMLERRS